MKDSDALFAETLCRFVVEVRPQDAEPFEHIFDGLPCAPIGRVTDMPVLAVRGRGGDLFRIGVSELERAWRGEEKADGGDQKPEARGKRLEASEQKLEAGRQSPISDLQSLPHKPRVLILHATGTNRDREAALACELAGGDPDIVHINQLQSGERHLLDYHMLVVPGGFSYGDDLGAGTLWALDLKRRMGEDVARFVAEGRPVLGICNGFQALVKSGLLPGDETQPKSDLSRPPQAIIDRSPQSVTLTTNTSQHFECRWVYLMPNHSSPCLFTQGIREMIYCPVAHGEGRLAIAGADRLQSLERQGLIALTYVDAHGAPADYPGNPNGSMGNIAGLCNPAGNVLGLMPHPEDHIFDWQHPRRQRGERGMLGLRLFENGIRAAIHHL